jgi:hypothetical protein
MPFQRPPHARFVLASALAAAGVVLTAASCSGHITPLGPEPGPTPTVVALPPVRVQFYKLGSPIILQVMQSQSAAGTGGCVAGLVTVFLPPGAAPMPCFRPVGTPVTITSAGLSAVSKPPRLPGQPAQPVSYGFDVAVPQAQVAAVTALIKHAYDSHGALGVSAGGKLWEAPQVDQSFSGQVLQIELVSKDQALELYRLLVSAG